MLHRKVQALGDKTLLKPLYLQVTNGKLLSLPSVSEQQVKNHGTCYEIYILEFYKYLLMLWCLASSGFRYWNPGDGIVVGLWNCTGSTWHGCQPKYIYWVLSPWKLQEVEGLSVWFCVTDILTYLSQTLSLEEICRVLPPGGENMYNNYVQICQQVGHANHIRALIMATGQQLLATLNLWPA
jgi:hypothetical protein